VFNRKLGGAPSWSEAVAVAAGVLAIGGEEIGPARVEMAADVFEDVGDAVVARGGLREEGVSGELRDRAVGDRDGGSGALILFCRLQRVFWRAHGRGGLGT
jgi:hypothetical protein